MLVKDITKLELVLPVTFTFLIISMKDDLNKKDISKKKEIKILKGKPDIKGIKE